MTGGEWTLAVDGGARGNPGPAGAGAVLTAPDGRVAATCSRPLGRLTNNAAEYEALLLGLALASEHGARRLIVRSDSELLVRQLEGAYRVRAPGLKALHERAVAALAAFERVTLDAVPREQNAAADRLANEAMDRAARAGAGTTR
jgi:ribonuclease HI